MSKTNFNVIAGDNSLVDAPDSANVTPRTVHRIAVAVALLTTSISLGIAMFAGMQRAGTAAELVWSVAMSLVAALCMHLAPVLWRFVSNGARFVLAVLWLLAASVVLRGQVDVLAFANMHAADKRAQTIVVVATPPVATAPSGRSLTAIMQDIAKVRIDLAHVEARRCVGECQALRARKVELSAQLAALNAEANEMQRRVAEHDWLRDQASRAEALRESRRSDPATSLASLSLGTTEARLNVLMDLACVLVLEGMACFAWYFAGLGLAESGRETVMSARNATTSRQEAVAPIPEATPAACVELIQTRAATIVTDQSVANDARPDHAMPEDDLLVAKIHEAVVAGRLKRNLASIRKFLECGQPKAIRLNRLYVARFGTASRVTINCAPCSEPVHPLLRC
ncbi:putative twin-arginine translocation pathway signal protein [Burkholderia pseudomallei]|nr:putative twin-arginine translocation pathway signal protein [Burkholderia pseudomallei]CAJ7616990.1 putative twin-arginine translocation pathway signal protein [Burkholderia pseudomallei]